MAASKDELLAIARELLAAIAQATAEEDVEPDVAPAPAAEGGCIVCGSPVQEPYKAYCSPACKSEKHGNGRTTGFVRQRIRSGERKAPANAAHAERIVAALSGLPARKGKPTEVEVSSQLVHALKQVTGRQPLPHEVAGLRRAPMEKGHAPVTVLTMDSAEAAKVVRTTA